MPYRDLQSSPEYVSKHAGSGIEVSIMNELNPSELVVGALSGNNSSEDFEAIPIEEVGNDGVDEIVQGRHSGSISCPGFWTPEWNDSLPTRQTFIGKRYTVMARIAEGRPQAGTVVNVWTGCTLTRLGQSHGARGALTIDMAFLFTNRYNGAEWAERAGT